MDIGAKLDEVMGEDEQPITVTIYQKNGDPYLAADGKTEATMTLLGNESQKVRQAKANNKRKVLRAIRAGKDLDEAADNAERVNVVFAALVEWSGWEFDGKPAELKLENVKRLCRAEHILLQAEQAIRAHADFFKAKSDA